MLKIQKISTVALMLSAVVSTNIFAEGKTDAKFNE